MSKEAEYLKERGWRFIMSRKTQYGLTHYWDHDVHQLRDGRWWTQGYAYAYQKGLDRRIKLPKGA